MLRTNLHWYFAQMWCGTWTEKILHSHFHALQPQVTAASGTSSYTVVTQWPPWTRCGDQVYTHNTHTVSNPAYTDCVTTTQQASCYQFGKSCAECSTKVSPLLAEVSRRDLEPELASNLCCLQVPVLFSFTDHSWFLLPPEHIFYPMQWKTC